MGNKISWTHEPFPARDIQVGNYDWWGYLPQAPRLKPSQHVWSTYFEPDAEARMNLYRPNDQRPWNQQYGVVETMAQGIIPTTMYDANTLPGNGVRLDGPVAGDTYKMVHFGPGHYWGEPAPMWTEQWMAQKKAEDAGEPYTQLPICNPRNFPNCTMDPILKTPNRWNDFANQYYEAGTLWADKIEQLYTDFYVNGNVDALSQINSEDTSAYDPCSQPGFFAHLGPLILGFLTGAGFQKLFAPDLRARLSNNTMIAWSFGTFGVGYFLMRAALDVFGPQKENLWWSATGLTFPLGMTIGDYFINQGTINASPNIIYLVSVAGTMFVLQPLAMRILTLPRVLNFLLGLVGSIFTVISEFLCRVTSPIPDACAKAEGGEHPFADARRWDAASIAAKLTDEVRELEGWDRSDPRAEFAFKAFLTGPALLDAARPGNSDKRPMWERPGHGNPMGSIYELQAQQWWSGPHAGYESNSQYYGSVSQVTGWDGEESDWLDVANSNNYACQNWDLLRNDEYTAKDPPKNPAEAKYVKDTFSAWVQAVRDAANVPSNLVHAGVGRATSGIPGWKGGKDTLEPTLTGWNRAQWLEFINGPVMNAKTVFERYNLVGPIFDTTTAPLDQDVLNWITANQQAYAFIQLKNNKGPAEVYQLFLDQICREGTCTEPQARLLSAYLYAVTATNEVDISSYWFNGQTEEMRTAMYKYDPPAGLPYGTLKNVIVSAPVSLGPSEKHWHKITPLGPVADSNSSCAVNIANLRNAPSNLQNNSIQNWLNIFDSLIKSPDVCKQCSQAHLNIAFGYKLAFEAARTPAVQNNYPGIASVLSILQNMKWSDRSMAALVQELMTPIANQAEVNEWMAPGAPFWNRTMWDDNNYAPLLATLLALDGSFDESSNICEHLGSLTPLDKVEVPLTDEHLARLYDPASERPKDFRSFVENVKGAFYKLVSGETPITSMGPAPPQHVYWPDPPPELRHLYHPDPTLPFQPIHVYWPNAPPDLKHLQKPPPPPGSPEHIYWPNPPPELKHIYYPDPTLPDQPKHIYWPTPPGDLKHLVDPPSWPTDPLHPLPKPVRTVPILTPISDTDDNCTILLNTLRNPASDPGYMNLPLATLYSTIKTVLNQNPCVECQHDAYYELATYADTLEVGPLAPHGGIQGVGDWIFAAQQANWSNNVLSKTLHTMNAQMVDQTYMIQWLAEFWAHPVSQYNNQDYSDMIKQLLAVPGAWDSTFPSYCS